MKAQRAALLAVKEARTIENTLERFNEIGRHLTNALGAGELLQNVHPDAKLRDAARACEQTAKALRSEVFTDKALFDAASTVDVRAADAPTRRFSSAPIPISSLA